MTTSSSSDRPAGFGRRAFLMAGAATFAAGPALLAAAPAHAAPQIGQPAPAFTALDSNGQTQSLSALKGKVVVLEWTNHDCPFVRKHYGAGNMQKLQAEAKSQGVVWLTIASSAPGEQGAVDGAAANGLTASRKAMPAAVLLDPDGKIGRAYGAQVTPHMYVIGKDGTLLYMGGIDSIASTRADDIEKAQPYLRDAMLAAVKGEPVKTAVTRPYGCTIKYMGT
jgi:peroxiredoxin